MRVSIGIAAGTLLAATPGCREPAGFSCSSDEQCTSIDGEAGRCSPAGACGYLDPACASGYRYSEYAPQPWARRCLAPQNTSETTVTDGSSTGASLEGSSSTQEPSSSTTGAPQPVCGNGELEDGELCDDGDDIEGNGCNPDCRASGVLLLSFTSQLGGSDEARTVMLTEEGDVVVGGLVGESPDTDGFVARYRADGLEIWREALVGSAGRVDAVFQVKPAASGNVRALGQVVNAAVKGVTPREDFWVAELNVQTGAFNWAFTRGEDPPSAERGYGLTVLADGDFIVAGRVGDASNSDFGVTRFSVVPDKMGAFQLESIWTQAFDGGIGARDFANAVAWDEGGRIVVGGALEIVADDYDRHLRMLDLDGAPLRPPCEDLGGDDPLAADDRIYAVAVGPSGEVAAAGHATRETEDGLDAWLGYYPPGTCDLLWVETEPGPGQGSDRFTAVAIDERSNIVVGGFLNTGNTEDAWLAKYDPTGQRLWAIEPVDGPGNGADAVTSVVIGQNREITVAGRLTRPGDTDLWVARYTP